MIPVETVNLFCQQHHAGAGTENGESLSNKFLEFADEAIFTQKLADGSGLAAGDYQPFDPFQLLGQPYGDRRHPQSPQGLDVFRKGTLHRQNADFLHIYHPTGLKITNRGAQAAPSRVSSLCPALSWAPLYPWTLRR